MAAKIRWDYVFAGVSAAVGIAYVMHTRGQSSSSSPVTNVFPPLNTDVGGNDTGEQGPTTPINTNGPPTGSEIAQTFPVYQV